MPYQFQIQFAGLCAFVPEESLDAEANKVDVLLVNPNSSEARGLLSRTLEPHSPLLRFDISNLPGVNGHEAAPKEVKASLELKSVDVSILLRKREGNQRDLPLNRGVKIKNGNSEEEEDFTWVPCIDEILPGAEIDSVFLEDEPGRGDVLAARIRLGEGTLRTEEVGRHQGDSIVAQFVPPPHEGEAVRQALAHWTIIENEISDSLDVVLVLRPFGRPDSEASELVLTPNTDKRIRVEISNLCCGLYIGEEGDGRSPEADIDFEGIFLLCKDPAQLRETCGQFPIPVPVRYPGRPSGVLPMEGGGQGINCTQARFSSLYKSYAPELYARGDAPARMEAPVLRRSAQPAGQAATAATSAAPPRQLQNAAFHEDPPARAQNQGSQAGQRLKVSIQRQLQPQLCWAAVAASVDGYYRGSTRPQHELVEMLLGVQGCDPECDRFECKQPFSTAEALRRLGCLQREQSGPADFRVIQHEISQNRPVVAGISRQGGDHAVILEGWKIFDGRPQLWVLDPKDGSSRLWEYEQLKSKGGWRRTCLTQEHALNPKDE